MNRLLPVVTGILMLLLLSLPAMANARLTGDATIEATKRGATLEVPITRPVPWRMETNENILTLDMREFRWTDLPTVSTHAPVRKVAKQQLGVDETRLTLVLNGQVVVNSADMRTLSDGSAILSVDLEISGNVPVDDERVATPPQRFVVAIDAGHGGIDPGASVGGLSEAPIVLRFARLLEEQLLRMAPDIDVVLTRREDIFVPLDERLTRARQGGADVLLSLHADALAEGAGQAAGTSVYTLAPDETKEATDRVIARHDGQDMIAGVNLDGVGDDVAGVLMDLARRDSAPAGGALARHIVAAFRDSGLTLNSRPQRHGNFAVLGAADFPSILVELGFLSDAEDRIRLTSEDWQKSAVDAMTQAIFAWAEEMGLR